MQPSNPQPRGSFSKPPELLKNIEAHDATRKPIKPTEQAAPAEEEKESVAATAEPTTQVDPEAERSKRIKEYKTQMEKDLDVTISDEDIKNYILKGRIAKEVSLVNGIMKGTMQTLRIEDLQEIDARMADIRENSKLTSKGIENEEAIIALSYAWTHADGKDLGKTAQDREAKIRKMGSLFIERASGARVSFDTLIRLVMQERDLLKK